MASHRLGGQERPKSQRTPSNLAESAEKSLTAKIAKAALRERKETGALSIIWELAPALR